MVKMKRNNQPISIIIILTLVVMNSCEKGTIGAFDIRNETDYTITIFRYGGYDSNFTNITQISLSKDGVLTLFYSDEKGGPPPPLLSTDSLVFIVYSNSLKKTYKPNMSEKNPFQTEYYEKGEIIGYSNDVPIYGYIYHILNDDFAD